MAVADTPISLTFDQALKTSTVTASSLHVFGKQTGKATGALTFSNADKTVTFTPAKPFSAGELVLVNLSHDVRAADTTPLRSAGYAFQFTIRTSTGAAQLRPDRTSMTEPQPGRRRRASTARRPPT